jgi:hypothetical protein
MIITSYGHTALVYVRSLVLKTSSPSKVALVCW